MTGLDFLKRLGQPFIRRIFRVLRDIGHTRTVSSAHPWTITEGTNFDYRLESEKTLKLLRGLQEQVFAE